MVRGSPKLLAYQPVIYVKNLAKRDSRKGSWLRRGLVWAGGRNEGICDRDIRDTRSGAQNTHNPAGTQAPLLTSHSHMLPHRPSSLATYPRQPSSHLERGFHWVPGTGPVL